MSRATIEPHAIITPASMDWYNRGHPYGRTGRHSGIAMLTPGTAHKGKAEAVLAGRQTVLEAVYARHPERFVKGRPVVASPPKSVWINPPASLPEGLIQREDASEILGAAGKNVLN